MTSRETLKYCRTDMLMAHPKSIDIFGMTPGFELIESVRQHGILEPIVVAGDQVMIVSGTRRWQAALIANQESVPVRILHHLTDPLLVTQAVLEFNVRAPFSVETVAIMATERINVSQELARRTDSPIPSKKSVLQQIAADVGQSYTSLWRAVTVVEVITKLERDGKKGEAEEVRDCLTQRSFGPAYKLVRTKYASYCDQSRFVKDLGSAPDDIDEVISQPTAPVLPEPEKVSTIESAARKPQERGENRDTVKSNPRISHIAADVEQGEEEEQAEEEDVAQWEESTSWNTSPVGVKSVVNINGAQMIDLKIFHEKWIKAKSSCPIFFKKKYGHLIDAITEAFRDYGL